MQSPRDPVEDALHSLASSGWARGDHERRLEELLLREFDRSAPASRRGRTRGMWIGGLAILVGGAVFAATGGREAVKKLLVRVHLVGSQAVVFEGELEPVDGTGHYQVQVQLESGRPAEVQVDVTSDGNEGETTKQVTVHVPQGDTDRE